MHGEPNLAGMPSRMRQVNYFLSQILLTIVRKVASNREGIVNFYEYEYDRRFGCGLSPSPARRIIPTGDSSKLEQ